MGLTMLTAVIEHVEAAASTLVFTNTRSQCERWFQAMLEARPDWAGLIALHHGSVDADMRRWVEAAMKSGQLKCVVCTASLDLGVDFLPVEQVLQIGSAKGVARLLQRAGRSGHAPGRRSRVTMVPTHSLEIVEASALRAAVEAGRIEPRRPPDAPLDVLVQHLVTVALGGGFRPGELRPEVRSAPSYRQLGDDAWRSFNRVTLPLARRGMVAAAVVMWARAVSEFGAIVILTYNPKVVSVLSYDRFTLGGLREALPVAAVMAIIALIPLTVLRTLRHDRSVSVTT